ncbi:MAG: NfeD family protein [Oscillospiraceae bacterium]|nr:NfeD family protein [Oscillospiraceae bacterium]
MGYLIFWGVVFVVALIAELASMQLVSIWFAVGAAGAFGAAMVHWGFAAQLLIFVLISVVLLLITRPLLAKFRVGRELRSNADLNIGEQAVVIETVDAAHGTGRVRLKGVDWMAVSETGSVIPVNTVVTVMRVEGSKLFVYDAGSDENSAVRET